MNYEMFLPIDANKEPLFLKVKYIAGGWKGF